MKVLLVGAGYMAQEYAKVLEALDIDFSVVGRGEQRCNEFRESFPNVQIQSGGLENLQINDYTHCIVASNIEFLNAHVLLLLKNGIKEILLEKPGGKNGDEINNLAKMALNNNANILLAYNRRFYASILKAEELIKKDGGLTSFTFEFTEWSHTISPLDINKEVKNNWFLVNSSHVVDTAFFLGGKPKEISTYYSGSLDWHLKASKFVGAGVTTDGVLFSYHANWEAPGRWELEFLTKNHRFIFKPMEQLQVQLLGSVAVNPIEIDDKLDKEFKPGLFLQTKSFLVGDYYRFFNIFEQSEIYNSVYSKISGY